MTGNCSTPSRAIALSRMTPVVVSSVEPATPATSALRSAPDNVSTQRRTGGARASSRLSEVGRGACRGRGENSGGGGSFKKKKRKKRRVRLNILMIAESLKKRERGKRISSVIRHGS